MRVGSGSHVGRVRKSNEDAFWHDGRRFVVADGMGGHAAGDVAARVACDAVRARPCPSSLTEAADASKEAAALQTVLAANEAVYVESLKDERRRGMGTTLTLAMVWDGKATVAHVGDSRAYLLRGSAIQRLTEDHSVVAEMMRAGGLSETEAVAHPYRHLLTRALGTAPSVEVDVTTIPLHRHDGLLLCTDGLCGVVSDEEILAVATSAPDPQEAVDRLIDLANDRGGPDNITAILVWPGVGERG